MYAYIEKDGDPNNKNNIAIDLAKYPKDKKNEKILAKKLNILTREDVLTEPFKQILDLFDSKGGV